MLIRRLFIYLPLAALVALPVTDITVAECLSTPLLSGDDLVPIPLDENQDGPTCGDEHLPCEERAKNRFDDCMKEAAGDKDKELGCNLEYNKDLKWYCPCEQGTIPADNCTDTCNALGMKCLLDADYMFQLCWENAETPADRNHCHAVRVGAIKHCAKSVDECRKPKLQPVVPQEPEQWA
jgi:hypothetical protein